MTPSASLGVALDFNTKTLSTIATAMVLIVGLYFVFESMWLAWRHKQALYESKNVLTPNELEFYGRLRRALPNHVILCQVSMSALLEPKTKNPREYGRRRMSFAQKYVDFVVCRPKRLTVVAIVELDDITHDPDKDARRDAMLNEAGYHVVRWHSRSKPNEREILKVIRKLDKA